MTRFSRLVADYRPIGLWAGLLMWVVWAGSIALGHANLDRTGQVIGTDHTAFHTAAVLLADGRGEALYDYPALPEFKLRQEEITGKAGFLDPYRNPPFYALLYLPTSHLPYLVSYGIWAVVGVLSFLAGLRLVTRSGFARKVGWSLSFFPVFAAVSFGQNTLLSFGVFGLVYRLLVVERRFLAGLASGLLLYKPQLLFGLGVWWLLGVRRYWPALVGLGITGSALGLLSALVVPDETAAWLRKLPDIARYDAFEFFNLHNPRGFGDLLTGDRNLGNWVGLAGLALSVVWLTWIWRSRSADMSVMFAAAVFATLWGSPHTMTYEWALAVLPAVILWDQRPDLRDRWVTLFGIGWVILFVSTPLTKAQLEICGLAVQTSVPVLAIVGLAAIRALGSRTP